MAKSKGPTQLEVLVNLGQYEEEDLPDERELGLAAYLFSRSGRLIEKKPVEMDRPGRGKAEFELKVKDRQVLLVKVGPDVENLKDLDRKRPIRTKVAVSPGKPAAASLDLPLAGWICWFKVPYLVTGSVENEEGFPICSGEVDIYEVDLRRCLLRLPDLVIERIRDALIDVRLLNPPPIELPELFRWPIWEEDDDWCGTGPKPPIPHRPVSIASKLSELPDEFAFAKARPAALPLARANLDAEMTRMNLADRESLLARQVFEDVTAQQLVYTTTTQFREMLIEKILVFRYWLCWPWIYWIWWPWCASLELLGTAELQPDGSFSETVWLSICDDDVPDLWFVVRQEVNGVERTIYKRYPVPCNTWWNHPSGDPVHLVVTDPEAIACHQNPETDVPGTYVMPLGIGDDGWYEVTQAHVKAPPPPLSTVLVDERGLHEGTSPYGTRLHLQMQFHDGLRAVGVNYYRWSWRREGTTTWTPIVHPVTHRHLTVLSGSPVIMSYSLGPNAVGAETDLFEVPDPALSWVIINKYDRSFAVWDTDALADGKYELYLEMFDAAGLKIPDPVAAGFKYYLPMASPGGGVWPVDDALRVDAGGIVLRIHLDNSDTVAEIESVALSGSTVADCQFLEYADPSDTVEISYEAYHPNGFLASYALSVRRGISGTWVESLSSTTPADPPGAMVSYAASHLLRAVAGKGPFTRCAFSVQLHTYPLTRDGFTRIRAYEDHDVSAFALTDSA